MLSLSSLPPEAQAAWIQAVFSIVGIGVAIAIPAIQHLRDRREREARELREARALALLLLPTLNVWLENIEDFQKRLRHHLDTHFPGAVDWGSVAEAVTLGEQGKGLAPKSHLMGPVARHAQQFFYSLASAQQLAQGFRNSRTTREDEAPRVNAVYEALESARKAALEARDAAHRLYNDQPA